MPHTRITDWSKVNITLTVPEAAGVLGIGVNQMYQLANRPGFPAAKIGNRIVIDRDGLREFIRGGRATATANEPDELAALAGRRQAAAAAPH